MTNCHPCRLHKAQILVLNSSAQTNHHIFGWCISSQQIKSVSTQVFLSRCSKFETCIFNNQSQTLDVMWGNSNIFFWLCYHHCTLDLVLQLKMYLFCPTSQTFCRSLPSLHTASSPLSGFWQWLWRVPGCRGPHLLLHNLIAATCTHPLEDWLCHHLSEKNTQRLKRSFANSPFFFFFFFMH